MATTTKTESIYVNIFDNGVNDQGTTRRGNGKPVEIPAGTYFVDLFDPKSFNGQELHDKHVFTLRLNPVDTK